MKKIVPLIDKLLPFLFNILFFVTPLIFFHKTSEVFEFNKMVFVYIIATLITGIWIAKSAVYKKLIFKRTILDIPIILFLTSQIISTILSVNSHTSFFGYYSRFHGGLLSTICYSLLYWAYVSNMDHKHTMHNIQYAIYSATIVAIYAALEHFGASPSCFLITGKFDDDCWVQDVRTRVFATIGQPNWLAAWIVALIPITWAQSLNNKKTLLLSTLFFAALLFTKSRSGILGFIFAFIIFWALTAWSNKKTFILTSICLLLAAILIGTPWTPSITQLSNKQTNQVTNNQLTTSLETGGTESGQIRKIVWKGAIDIWKHYPIFGTGVETFAYSYYQFRPSEHNMVSEWDFLYNKAHNEYLNIAANSGSVGIITYITLIAISIYTILKSKSSLQYALLAGYVSILITNFFGFSVVIIGLLFFLYPAIAVSLSLRDTPQTKYKKVSSAQIISLLILLFGICYLIFAISRYWYADYLYAKGKTFNNSSQQVEAVTVLDQAVQISPSEPSYRSELSQSLGDLAVSYVEGGDATSAAKLAKAAVDEDNFALALAPVNINLRRSVASLLTRLSEINPDYLTDAGKILEETLPLTPTDPKTYFQLGLNYARTKRLADGIKIIQKAVEMKPDYKDARHALAIIYASMGKTDEAKKELQYILEKITPNDESIKSELEKIK